MISKAIRLVCGGGVVLLALAGCGEKGEEESEWSFTMSHVKGKTDSGEKVKIGEEIYFGQLSVLTSFEGSLDEMPEDRSDLDREFSPILFSNEESQFQPGVATNMESTQFESVKQITYFCSPYQEEPDMPLKRRTIYYYDTEKRGVVEIGKFAADDDREAIGEKAREAIIRHVDASDRGSG